MDPISIPLSSRECADGENPQNSPVNQKQFPIFAWKIIFIGLNTHHHILDSDAKRMDNFVNGCGIKKGFAGNKMKLDKLAAAKCL